MKNIIEKIDGWASQGDTQLFPWWMKLYSFFTLLFAFIIFYAIVFMKFSPEFSISMFGLSTIKILSPLGIFLAAILFLNTITAILIFKESIRAIAYGKVLAILAIVICSITMLVRPILNRSFDFEIRFEIILFAIFYAKLIQIEKRVKHFS